MSDDEKESFSLFIARERVRQAELAHKGVEEALSRTKSRATSLLGWSTTLATASVAAVITNHTERRAEAAIAAVGFFATSVLCARVLFSTRISPLAQPPARFDAIMNAGDEQSEVGFFKAFAELADELDTKNDAAVSRDQKTMRMAWVVGCATPVASLLAALGFWAVRHWPGYRA